MKLTSREYKPRRSRASFNPEDIVGQRFGRLVVQRYSGREQYRRRYTYSYECLCDCGRPAQVGRVNLISDHTLSCGCLQYRKMDKNPGWTGHGEISGMMWAGIRGHATHRELVFNITIQDAWEIFLAQGRRCALTGEAITISMSTSDKYSKTASLDRIDNSLGYEKSNIQWVHKDVNWMKGRFALKRFVELCHAVSDHHRRAA